MPNLYDTDFDPLALLLELAAKCEELETTQNRIIEVLNNQTGVIQTQSQFIETLYKRIQLLEERTQ